VAIGPKLQPNGFALFGRCVSLAINVDRALVRYLDLVLDAFASKEGGDQAFEAILQRVLAEWETLQGFLSQEGWIEIAKENCREA